MNAGIGHNRPPLDEELAAEMADVIAPYRERAEALLADSERAQIRDSEDIGKIGDLAKMIKAIIEVVDEQKGKILSPVYDAQGRVLAVSGNFTTPLEDARAALGQKVDDFRADQKRKAEEKQKKQREFERELARQKNVNISDEPSAPVATPQRATPARGDYGGRVGQRSKVDVEIEDLQKIPDYIMQSRPVQEAILKVAKSMANSLDEIPGIKITRGLKTNFG